MGGGRTFSPRHQAIQQDRDRILLHALALTVRRLARSTAARPRRATGTCRGQVHRGDRQHHAEQRAPRDTLRGGASRGAHLPREADRQHACLRAAPSPTPAAGRRRARARLRAPRRKPLPGPSRADPSAARSAGWSTPSQHQPRPARQDRPLHRGAIRAQGMPGGVMLQIGIHYSDVLEYLMGPIAGGQRQTRSVGFAGGQPDVASLCSSTKTAHSPR